MITYRILEKSEADKLTPTLQALGWTIPYPQFATVLVAEENGEIIGFIVQQIVPHLEPAYVRESHRGQGIADELAQRGAEIFKASGVERFVATAANAHSERICRDVLGMKKVEGSIYKAG